MKKLAALCLTVVLMLSFCVCGTAAAEEDGLAGLWKLAEMTQDGETMGEDQIGMMEAAGTVIYMEFTADGQAMISYAGTESRGTYDDQNITIDNEPAGYTLEDGYLVISEGTVSMKFERTTQEALNAILGAEEGVLDETVEYSAEEVKILDLPEGSVTITGYSATSNGFDIYVHCENTSDNKLMFSTSKCILNHYQINPTWAVSLEAGTSQDGKISFQTPDLKKAGISSVDELITETYAINAADYSYLAEDVVTTIYPTGKTAEDIVPADRVTSETETVFVDDENCTFVVLEAGADPILGYAVNCYFENKTDKDLTFMWGNTSLNGEELVAYFAEEVPAGTRGYSDAIFLTSTMEEHGITDVNEIGFELEVYDENGFLDPVLETQCLYTP